MTSNTPTPQAKAPTRFGRFCAVWFGLFLFISMIRSIEWLHTQYGSSSFERCNTILVDTFHGFDSSDSFCNHIVYGTEYEPLIPFPEVE